MGVLSSSVVVNKSSFTVEGWFSWKPFFHKAELLCWDELPASNEQEEASHQAFEINELPTYWDNVLLLKGSQDGLLHKVIQTIKIYICGVNVTNLWGF